MKLNTLENFEERFYFKTSHLFWHFLIGLSGLALVVGILMFLWGLTPSFKPGVSKPKYPKPVQVETVEIMQKIRPAAIETTGMPAEPTQPAVSTDKVEPDPAEAAYLAALDSLKALLPPDKYRWESRGHWEQDWYGRRKWVVDVLGTKDRLESAFKNVNAGDYASKKQLLDAYIALVALFPVEQRLTVLKSAIEFSKDDVSTSIHNVSLLQAAVPNFSTDNADFIETLATFGRKNPRDGRTFIEYANASLPKFSPEVRRPILATLVSSYYKYFNDIGKQQEATDLFLEMRNDFEPELQAKALSEYYPLYLEKNAARARQIAEMEEEYQRKLAQAQSIVSEKKARKATYRTLGWQAIVGGLVFIAFVAMFLVLLSIQRNIKQIREMTGSVAGS